MGKDNSHNEAFTHRGNLSTKEHYQAIVEVISTLLDLGVIQLPDLSSQWKGYINAALNGDNFLLKQAMERWEKSGGNLLASGGSNPLLQKWKQSEADYLMRVHKILTFYNLITSFQ